MDSPSSFVQTLFRFTDAHAHRLPLRASSRLYNAQDFGEPIKTEVVVKTWNYETAAVEVYSGGVLFASCPLQGEKYTDSVERTIGSSRYFVLKVVR